MTSGYEQFLLNLVRTAGYDYPLARTTIPNTNRKGCTKCTALLLVELSLFEQTSDWLASWADLSPRLPMPEQLDCPC